MTKTATPPTTLNASPSYHAFRKFLLELGFVEEPVLKVDGYHRWSCDRKIPGKGPQPAFCLKVHWTFSSSLSTWLTLKAALPTDRFTVLRVADGQLILKGGKPALERGRTFLKKRFKIFVLKHPEGGTVALRVDIGDEGLQVFSNEWKLEERLYGQRIRPTFMRPEPVDWAKIREAIVESAKKYR